MRIRFLDSIISSDGLFGVGQVHDLPDELAAGFISTGRAEPAQDVEEATAPAARETAVTRKNKGR